MNDTITVELIPETCCSCGAVFGMTKTFRDQRLRDGNWFCCPAGHSQRYTKSEAARATQAEKDAKYWETEAQRLLEEVDRLRAKLGKTHRAWREYLGLTRR